MPIRANHPRLVPTPASAAGLATTAWRACVIPGTLALTLVTCHPERAAAPQNPVALPPPVAVTGPPVALEVGTTYQMTAILNYDVGKTGAPPLVTWSSADTLVATITAQGVVNTLSAGITTISAQAQGRTGMAFLEVKPTGIAIVPQGEFGETVVLGPGQTLQLDSYEYDPTTSTTYFAYVPITWASSNPSVATVSSSGLVTGIDRGIAVITASVGNVKSSRPIQVTFTPGSATVRFVHAADGYGAITLQPNTGAAARISFGDVIEEALPAGTLQLIPDGFPAIAESHLDFSWLGAQQFSGYLPAGAHATFVAVGDTIFSTTAPLMLAPLWDWTGPIEPDSVMVRIVLATTGGYNVYLVSAGDPMRPPDLAGCYLDWPYGTTAYQARRATNFDIVLQAGKGVRGGEAARFPVTPQPGRATTYILTGPSPATLKVLTLVDP